MRGAQLPESELALPPSLPSRAGPLFPGNFRPLSTSLPPRYLSSANGKFLCPPPPRRRCSGGLGKCPGPAAWKMRWGLCTQPGVQRGVARTDVLGGQISLLMTV